MLDSKKEEALAEETSNLEVKGTVTPVKKFQEYVISSLYLWLQKPRRTEIIYRPMAVEPVYSTSAHWANVDVKVTYLIVPMANWPSKTEGEICLVQIYHSDLHSSPCPYKTDKASQNHLLPGGHVHMCISRTAANRTPLNSSGCLAVLGFIFNCKVLKSVPIPMKQTDCLGFTTNDHNIMKVEIDREDIRPTQMLLITNTDPSMSVRET